MPGELADKVILLTGGGDGIGAECALAYAHEGARVAILDRNVEAAQAVAACCGSASFALKADVADGEQVKQAVAEVLRLCGRIDAVHNNAGVASPSLPVHSTTEPEWDHLFRVNVKSVYWTTRFAFPALADSKGTILNTASMVGLVGPERPCSVCCHEGRIDLAD